MATSAGRSCGRRSDGDPARTGGRPEGLLFLPAAASLPIFAADLEAVPSRIAVLVGEKDELFNAELFAPTVLAVRADAKVTVIPGINHIELTTDPRAVPAIVASIRGQD